MMPLAGAMKSILWETRARQTIIKTIVLVRGHRAVTRPKVVPQGGP